MNEVHAGHPEQGDRQDKYVLGLYGTGDQRLDLGHDGKDLMRRYSGGDEHAEQFAAPRERAGATPT